MGGIRRKLAARGGEEAGRGGAPALWPVVLARAARDGIGLDLAVAELVDTRRSLAELLDTLPERGLYAVLEGPGEGLGLMVLGPTVLAGVVEWQTLGRVTAQLPLPRRPTRTDAAMAAGLIDAALGALDGALATEGDRVWAAGFRYASFLEEPRPLGLMLEDVEWRVLAAEVRLGGGAKAGPMILALPALGRGQAPPSREVADVGTAQAFGAALGAEVMGAEAVLEAVIARVTLPLAQVMALAAGEVLLLGPAALDRIDLAGLDGQRIAGGRLGQARGLRAVRLTEAAQPAARTGGSLAPGVATVEEGMRRTGTG